MKYFGSITGLSVPGAIPTPLPADERPGPNYPGLALLCLVGIGIGAGIVYLVGRKRR